VVRRNCPSWYIETDPYEHARRHGRNCPLQHHSARSHSRVTLHPHGPRSVLTRASSTFQLPTRNLRVLYLTLCTVAGIKFDPEYIESHYFLLSFNRSSFQIYCKLNHKKRIFGGILNKYFYSRDSRPVVQSTASKHKLIQDGTA